MSRHQAKWLHYVVRWLQIYAVRMCMLVNSFYLFFHCIRAGVIYAEESTVKIDGITRFTNNSASHDGGEVCDWCEHPVMLQALKQYDVYRLGAAQNSKRPPCLRH